ncbi:MAG: NAD(P)H-dependent oxidoreductase [Caulobacteraceae bacterium]|nr:NAD(P)H-dependent oxidoreductase [Caulobacteraceae bacterium]
MTAPEAHPFIVGIGGTVRPNSSSEKALARALEAAEALGARTRLFGGAFLSRLPHYNPHDPTVSEEETEYLEAVRACDGLIVATPGYHGSLSGLIKNALDVLEGLREDGRPYFDGRAVGCIVTANGVQAGGSALAALRAIVHAMRGWPTPLGVTLNASEILFSDEGALLDPQHVWAVGCLAGQVVGFARAQAA